MSVNNDKRFFKVPRMRFNHKGYFSYFSFIFKFVLKNPLRPIIKKIILLEALLRNTFQVVKNYNGLSLLSSVLLYLMVFEEWLTDTQSRPLNGKGLWLSVLLLYYSLLPRTVGPGCKTRLVFQKFKNFYPAPAH